MTKHNPPCAAVDPVTAKEEGARLTDHEWRMQEAIAGRAHYVPGNPEAKAELEAMRKAKKPSATEEKKSMITLTMSLDDTLKLRQATENVPYLVSSAANVFRMLWSLTSAGFTPPEDQLCAIYELCARGLESAAAKEGDTLDRFDMELRDALKAEGITE
jgi:hypothetical protein